jgi:hypothetical protein
VARALGYRPAGTAGSAAAFVLVEAPLPWPPDVGTHPLLAPLAPVVGGAGGRLQAVVPQGDTPAGEVRVVALRRSPGPFTTFDRAERLVPADGLTEALADLLAPAEARGSENEVTRIEDPAEVAARMIRAAQDRMFSP